MAGWLIDTSVLVDAERGVGGLEQIPEEDEHAISIITASELLHGVHRAADGVRRTQRRAFVEHVLADLEVLPITLEIGRIHAEIWAQLEATGDLVGAHDLWIAATALANGMSVVTGNARDFERIPGLEMLVV